jgi:hypothetical protein
VELSRAMRLRSKPPSKKYAEPRWMVSDIVLSR